MKTNYLFPPICKRIGWMVFIPFAIIYVLTLSDVIDDYLISFPTLCLSFDNYSTNRSGLTWESQGMLMEISLALSIVALLLISFSRERDEDEMISALRFRFFAWAIKLNAILLIVGTWFIFGSLYLWFVIFCLFSTFLLYIARFEYELYQLKKLSHEE